MILLPLLKLHVVFDCKGCANSTFRDSRSWGCVMYSQGIHDCWSSKWTYWTSRKDCPRKLSFQWPQVWYCLHVCYVVWRKNVYSELTNDDPEAEDLKLVISLWGSPKNWILSKDGPSLVVNISKRLDEGRDRQTDRQTDGRADRQFGRQTDGQIKTDRQWLTDRLTDLLIDWWIDWLIDLIDWAIKSSNWKEIAGLQMKPRNLCLLAFKLQLL